jgi:Uma2 family endonuclease
MSEMAVTAEAPPAPAADEAPYAIRPITVDEYHRMLEVGILYEREPVELLDGQLIAMPSEGPLHAAVVSDLNALLLRTFDGRATIRPGNPVELDRLSEPAPDLALVRTRDERYRDRHPNPNDVLLLVEVSLSSLWYDRGRKLSAYARAGIREYWMIDLVHRQVVVFTEPRDDGYAKQRVVEREGSIAPAAFPNDPISVADFLP